MSPRAAKQKGPRAAGGNGEHAAAAKGRAGASDGAPAKDVPSPERKGAGQKALAVLLQPGTWTMYGFYKEALQGIQRVAFSQGYGLVIVDPAPQGDLDKRELFASLSGSVSGLLLVAPAESDGAFYNALARERFPAVSLYRRLPQLSYIVMDNQGGAVAAVEHLAGLGHTRIAFLSGPPDAPDGQERLAGYLKALEKLGQPYRKEYVLSGDFEQNKGYAAMKQLLALKKPPTAVFAANDFMALGAISAIQDEGLSVPGHVAVVGFDDIEVPTLTFRAPSLTTVRQPIYDIAKEGAQALILLIEGRVTELRQKIFPSQLIVRSTCGAGLKKPA
jgi:DNA-binding LacI/PurR family transcriptional regulator